MSKSKSKITLALALRNDRNVDVRVGPKGAPNATIAGQMLLTPACEAELLAGGKINYFPPREAPDPNQRVAAEAVINLGGDYDSFSEALYSMAQTYTPDTPIFNNPTGIALVRKEHLTERLAGVDGLKVPRAVRVKAVKPDSFEQAFTEGGLTYPITVQSTTTAYNRDVVIIKSAEDWPQALRLKWAQRWFYITELGSTPLVQHMRLKICFVGTQVEMIRFPFAYPPHPLAANAQTTARVDEARLAGVLKALYRGVPLDFWTVELSILPSGDFRLEHLWVGLPLRGDTPAIDAVQAIWKKVAPKVDALVRTPARWRHSLEKAARAAQMKH